MNEDTVRVAVRIRPLVKTEIEKGCQTCLNVVNDEPQIIISNTDKAFTFNYVFSPDVGQEYFYNTAIKEMVKNIFQGKTTSECLLVLNIIIRLFSKIHNRIIYFSQATMLLY